MKNMIDVLASTTDTTGTIRASDIKAAFLYIATPYDTKIDLELIAYAKQNNIIVVQFLAEYSSQDPKKIRFTQSNCLTNDWTINTTQLSTGVIR